MKIQLDKHRTLDDEFPPADAWQRRLATRTRDKHHESSWMVMWCFFILQYVAMRPISRPQQAQVGAYITSFVNENRREFAQGLHFTYNRAPGTTKR